MKDGVSFIHDPPKRTKRVTVPQNTKIPNSKIPFRESCPTLGSWNNPITKRRETAIYISTYLLGRHNIIISVDVGMKMDGSLEANHKIMDDIIFDDDRSVSDVGVDFFDWEQIVREAEENGEDDDSDISFDMEGVEEVPTDDEFEYDSDWDSIESIEMKPKGYKPANVPPPIQ